MSKFTIQRYPKSNNRSLRAWSAADEYLVEYCNENTVNRAKRAIYNDSFGYLTLHLNTADTVTVVNQKSQELAILKNGETNTSFQNSIAFSNPLDELSSPIELAVVKIPKSIDLFELYIQHAHQNLVEDGQIVSAFMTRHFTAGYIKVAEKYFTTVEQSKAVKKARLVILRGKKEVKKTTLLHTIDWNENQLKQYYGVFSSGNVDYATQFLIEHISIPEDANNLLDLASGNGVLAKVLNEKKPSATIHLIDDSFLAIESSKLNLKGGHFNYYYDNGLDQIINEALDYVISNPPFHLEHEIDISLPLSLFQQVQRCLKKGGTFQLVANAHLNYMTHLSKLFSGVEITAQNKKFTVYTCQN